MTGVQTCALPIFGLNTSAAVLGLGYIIGLKYAMIITAGSCLVWFLVVPLVGSLADSIDPAAMASLLGVTRADIMADPQRLFTAENLFAFIGKPLGIGGIAMAGIIGIVKQSKIIRQAVGLAVSELGGGNKTQAAATERTQRDLTMKRILTILIATLVSIFVFFHFGLLDGWVQSVTAILIVFVISFLFTTVAANAIAIVGTNPVSGMTLMTLILSSLVLVSVGLSGTTGMTAALIIGGVVCTALSMAGGFITDLKIGYWLGKMCIRDRTCPVRKRVPERRSRSAPAPAPRRRSRASTGSGRRSSGAGSRPPWRWPAEPRGRPRPRIRTIC